MWSGSLLHQQQLVSAAGSPSKDAECPMCSAVFHGPHGKCARLFASVCRSIVVCLLLQAVLPSVLGASCNGPQEEQLSCSFADGLQQQLGAAGGTSDQPQTALAQRIAAIVVSGASQLMQVSTSFCIHG